MTNHPCVRDQAACLFFFVCFVPCPRRFSLRYSRRSNVGSAAMSLAMATPSVACHVRLQCVASVDNEEAPLFSFVSGRFVPVPSPCEGTNQPSTERKKHI